MSLKKSLFKLECSSGKMKRRIEIEKQLKERKLEISDAQLDAFMIFNLVHKYYMTTLLISVLLYRLYAMQCLHTERSVLNGNARSEYIFRFAVISSQASQNLLARVCVCVCVCVLSTHTHTNTL